LRGAQTAYLDNVLSSIRAASWEGAAADAALRQMTPLGRRIQVASTQADSVASLLGAGAQELRGAQKQLNDAIDDADGIHLRVGDDGSLALPEMSAADRRDPESIRYWGLLRQQAEQIATRFQTALRIAEDSDRRLSEELAKLGADGDYATALAVAHSDVAALGNAGTARVAGLLGRVNLGDLRDQDLSALKAVDLDERPERRFHVLRAHGTKVRRQLRRVGQSRRLELLGFVQPKDNDATSRVGDRRQALAQRLGQPALGLLHLDIVDVRTNGAKIVDDLRELRLEYLISLSL
jgi:hypothetical protein